MEFDTEDQVLSDRYFADFCMKTIYFISLYIKIQDWQETKKCEWKIFLEFQTDDSVPLY